MAMAGNPRSPPRNCPICGEKIWPREGVKWAYQAQSVYDTHVYENHREYGKWSYRTLFYYLIPVLVFVGSAGAAWLVQALSAPNFLVVVTFFAFWALAFAAGVAVRLFRRRGTRRFHELWITDHGRPVNPP